MGHPAPAAQRNQLIADLIELVEALDRRTPGLASAGEAGVAQDAAALKRRAQLRILELEAERRVGDSDGSAGQ